MNKFSIAVQVNDLAGGKIASSMNKKDTRKDSETYWDAGMQVIRFLFLFIFLWRGQV